MTKDNDSHSSQSTSSGNLENAAISPNGMDLEKLYALEVACKILMLSERSMKELRRRYLNKGILKIGNTYVCIGMDLLKIIITESESNE